MIFAESTLYFNVEKKSSVPAHEANEMADKLAKQALKHSEIEV